MVFYDPYDYNYGMIMEISNPENNFGDYYDPEGYTTANEISVSPLLERDDRVGRNRNYEQHQ